MSACAQTVSMLRFLTAGSVDDGKSTLIGRLLYECNGVYVDQLESVRKASAIKDSALDLSLITDGLRAEREQAITIDVGFRYFSTAKRTFIIADTPGHEQYTRNMITGASNAELAVLLVDARKGILQQTRRHAYLVWLLGIRRLVIAVNKMDLVGFHAESFLEIQGQFASYARFISGMECYFVPVSALTGSNVVERSKRMPWYDGPSLLELLENLPLEENCGCTGLRFPIQTVLRPSQDFRGYGGQVISGAVTLGQDVLALPSRRMTRVEQIFLYDSRLQEAVPPQSVVLTLADHIDLGRGDMLVDAQRTPSVSNRFVADVIWMSETPLRVNVPYLIKHTTQTLCGTVLTLFHCLDIDALQRVSAASLHMNEIGRVEIQTHKPLFFDPYKSNRGTGRFILIDPFSNNTVGAGIICTLSAAPWDLTCRESEGFPANEIGQHPRGLTVWFTGLSGAGKTTICNALCTELLARGFRVEVLDGDIMRMHLCSDLGFSRRDRNENIRRIGFVAELLTRNGTVVLVSAISPYRAARDAVRAKIGDFLEVHVNAPLSTCEQRDSKGLYKKARAGEISGFTGIDDPYEPPLTPEIVCNTAEETIRASTQKVISKVLAMLSSRTQI